MEEKFEELKKRGEAIDMLLDIMAESGDLRFIFVKKRRDLSRKMYEISIDNSISDDKFKKMNNLLDQFENMLNDIKEEK
nr:MAG TPA: hypothetical protein [Bacteriophage sp.]